ncbi:MAG TPA: hypothetical protein VFG76_12935, partial [Candidatus Polarisedimenticolia bacterium]|nr:hypothetical protein [Candidatus Polarisedimenticolia bacterium]
MRPLAGRWLGPLLAACFLFVFVWQALDHLDSGVAEKDQRTYLTIAYNMARHGSFSSDVEGPRNEFTPTAVKPPGYPVLLAAGIWLSPALSGVPQERLFEKEAQGLLWFPKLLQFGCLLAAAVCAATIVFRLTGNRVLSWCALALVGLDPELHRFAGRFNSENLALLLITVASLCLMRIVEAPAPRKFALAGAVFAALALTRAIYYHFWVFAVILFLCLA